MADLTIHGVSDDVLRKLERQAADAGQSLNDYLVSILAAIAQQHDTEDRPPRLDATAPDALDETTATLSDADAMRDITNGDAAYARGDVVRGAEAIRALRPQDRS